VKKSKYCVLLLVILFLPLFTNLIYDQIPRSYRNIELAAPDFDARNYIGLGTSELREGLTGENITVAVLDTGIDADHSVFTPPFGDWKDRITFYDYEENSTTNDWEDIQWHGTWAASIFGGNSLDYKGVAPNVNILAMKVFFMDNGEPSSTVGILEQAVDWLIYNKDIYSVRIASMSLGLPYDADINAIKQLNNAVEKLVENGICVVAAAGNSGENGFGTIESPASAESVLAVGGVDYNGNMFSQSSKGPTYEGITKPDVCAPAVDVQGADPTPPFPLYITGSGTSASTPFVSGLAALMLEKQTDLTPLELKSIISLTSYRTIDPRTIKDNIQGWGIVKGYAALDALNPPVQINANSRFEFTLNESYPVLCIPINIKAFDNYFLQLNQKNTAEAEIYLFDDQPDEAGNPQLITHSISMLEPYDTLNRVGLSSFDSDDYYMVVKLVHGTGNGDFSITMVIEYRLGVFFGLVGINLLGLVYIGFQFKKFQGLKARQIA